MNRSKAAATMRYRIGIPRSGMGMPWSGNGTANMAISATHKAPRMLEREPITLRRLGAWLRHQQIEEPGHRSLGHVADVASRVGDVGILDVTPGVEHCAPDGATRKIDAGVKRRDVRIDPPDGGRREYRVALMPAGVLNRLPKRWSVPDERHAPTAEARCIPAQQSDGQGAR